jgi:hypothetical protein
MTLGQLDLLRILSSAGYCRGAWGMPKDLTYSTLSTDFIREALPEWVDSLPAELVQLRDVGGGKTVHRPRWEAECGDCDTISWDFCAFLSRCMWLDAVKTRQSRGNVAVGLIYFRPTLDTQHCIVWWVDHEQMAHHVDPQSFEIDHLTTAQLGTIFGGEYA